jgi:hypothetical protein
MASTAVANGISHAALGITLGAAIESVMPASAAADDVSRALELAVQMSLNGLAVYGASMMIELDGDSTHGVPFSLALLYSQPSLAARVADMSRALQGTMRRFVPKTPALA